MPRSAFSRSLIEATRSSCCVWRNPSLSSSSRYSSSATRFGSDRSQLFLELDDSRPDRLEVPRRVVLGGERRVRHAVRPPRLLLELLAPHPALRRPQVDLVDRGDEPAELAVHRPLVDLDRAQLRRELLVALCRPPHLGVHPVALDRNFARARVG